jgi:hypothetical protein
MFKKRILKKVLDKMKLQFKIIKVIYILSVKIWSDLLKEKEIICHWLLFGDLFEYFLPFKM